MRADAARPWAPFRARQSIALDHTGFAWRAVTGPLGLITITDALDESGPRLRAVALGCIPLVHADADDALTKGELQRYLAELPLAPDAILSNRTLDWDVVDAITLRVTTGHGAVRAHVDLRLDGDGFVVSAFAPDRPRLEGSASVERPWTGRFSDYRLHAGRRLPFAAEVAWTLGGAEVAYWCGEMKAWALDARE